MKQIYKYILLFTITCICSFSYGQDVSLYQQYNGRYAFTFVGNTLNVMENNIQQELAILTQSSASINLQPGDQVESAFLYWAGSGPGDFNVKLNGQTIVAERTFLHERLIQNNPYEFFGAFADITEYVQLTGNGNYTFSDLDISAVLPAHFIYKTNFAGWAIIIVYENQNLPLNQLNVYDGLQGVPNTLSITLDNLNVIDNIGSQIGFLAWEGDSTLAVTESLKINGIVIGNPPLNPNNNAFNSTNSITGASNLFNMDLDIYPVENMINVGDTTALIELTSGQDFVMINAVVSQFNSQLPDATVTGVVMEAICDDPYVKVEFTVFNNESTDILPAGTPITFYRGENVLQTLFTQSDIPVGGSETNIAHLYFPLMQDWTNTLTIVVDDNGQGQGIVNELDENNNTYEIEINILISPSMAFVQPITSCYNCTGSYVHDLNLIINQLDYLEEFSPGLLVSLHLSYEEAQNNQNPLPIDELFVAENLFTSLFIRLDNGDCFSITEVGLLAILCPPDVFAIDLQASTVCDSRIVTVNYSFGNNLCTLPLPVGTAITFMVNQLPVALDFTTQIVEPGATYQGTFSFEVPDFLEVNIEYDLLMQVNYNYIDMVTGVVEEFDIENNTAISSFLLLSSPDPIDLPTLESCNIGFTKAIFDLTETSEMLNNHFEGSFNFYLNENDAINQENPIGNIFSFEAPQTPFTLYINLSNGDCSRIITQLLTSKKCPPVVYNFISLNNNGYNDSFIITGLLDIFLDFELTIFNKWGHKIWAGKNADGFWDGTSKFGVIPYGNRVPDGTYFYVLELNDSEYPEPLNGYLYITK